MSPLEKIQTGIEQQNWSLVAEGYKAMTGIDVKIAKRSVKSLLEEALTLIKDDKPTKTSKKEVVPSHQLQCELCGQFADSVAATPIKLEGKLESVKLCPTCLPIYATEKTSS